MGATDPIIIPFYKKNINNIKPTALLGFRNNNMFCGDLFDLSLDNWDINCDWKINTLYKTIICLRCAYFSKNPEGFMNRCYENLDRGGFLYVDWALGDHWSTDGFSVGWLKNGKHKWAYKENNFLWSTIWDDIFLEDEQCKVFQDNIKNKGYNNLKEAVHEEVPIILQLEKAKSLFRDVTFNIMTTTKPYLQMYVLLKCQK
jgi:hypothetical protein